MVNESVCAEFPNTWEEFIEQNSFEMGVGPVEGSAEAGNCFMDVYRVKQMMWYYLRRDYLRLGADYSSGDYKIDILESPLWQGADPRFRIERRDG